MNSETTALLEAPVEVSVTELEIPSVHPKALFDRVLIPVTTLLVFICALPILSTVPGRDQGTYLTIGDSLLAGKHLYSQLWDNKPPGIFFVYAGIVRIFGRVMWSVAVVEIILLFAISCLLFKFVERYLGRTGAALAVVTHAAWYSGMLYYWLVQPETLQGLCALSAYLLIASHARAWKVRCLAAGLICGCGFWLKYNFVVFLPLLVFLPFLDVERLSERSPSLGLSISWHDWFSRAVAVGSGFLVAIFAMMTWIVGSGGWPMMREAQFEVLPRYAHMGMTAYQHYWLVALLKAYLYLGPSTVAVALAALIIGWRSRDLKRLLPLFIAAAVALASVAMQVRFHTYYFQICYPFFAPLWAYVAVRLFEGTRALAKLFKEQNRRLAAALVWVVFGNLIFWPLPGQITDIFLHYESLQQWRSNPDRFYANYPDSLSIELLQGQLDVVHYVQNNTKPGDSIYVWGSNSLIYFLTDRKSPTRFVLNLGVIAKWGQPSWIQEVAHDVKAAQPRLIIVTRHDAVGSITYVNMDSEQYLKTSMPELRDYIAQNYQQAAEFKDFVIYQKN